LYPGSAASPETHTNTVNVRGELIDRGTSLTSGAGHTRTRTNAGCLISTTIPYDLSTYDASLDPTTDAGSCDRVNGVPLSPGTGGSATVYNGQSYPQGTNNVVTFDATGRETKTVTTKSSFLQGEPGQTGGQHTPPSTAMTWKLTTNRGYDVENHLRSLQYVSNVTRTNADTLQVTTTTSSSGTPTPIDWGPNGHPIRIPQYTAQPNLAVPTQSGFLTLHWDGDVILFVTDDSGNVVDFRAGLDGDITPRDPNFTGLTVYDRDAAGVIVQSSNATGSTGFNPLDPSTASGPGAAGTPGFKAPNVLAQYARSDGFAVASGIQINGVRAFYSNLGAWATPDAFEGDIHDPASQQRYMWNRGNPVDYGDPSGYDAWAGFTPNPISEHAMIILTNEKGEAVRYSWGPANGTRNSSDRTSNSSASSSGSSSGSSMSAARTGRMTIDHGTQKSLSDSAYTWKHLSLTSEQTRAVQKALDRYGATHTDFSLTINNCDTVIGIALREAGLGRLADQLTGIPALDAHNHMDQPPPSGSGGKAQPL
jgi:hypothetical protein